MLVKVLVLQQVVYGVVVAKISDYRIHAQQKKLLHDGLKRCLYLLIGRIMLVCVLDNASYMVITFTKYF
ncbi:hypothetical protein LWM68_09455 [Niabella sp. W65]|jgi:hypothetical protein|nr:hypothetical protein [Niabella sp. W65]MCH7362974.1 hypothetical protein [Niabella sp. W65]ULT38911.1 hypothetical protein KRR40_28120 [Niabella sp. I65]